MASDAVRASYASFGEREWARLENPDDGAVEFAITGHTIESFLPTHARVLDIGGGPGRYAIWLAENGHHVVLADLSPELLAIARRQIDQTGIGDRIEEITEADARDLSHWPDESFDAALCLGPFYHLPDPNDRVLTAAELSRVLRPGGLAFVGLMPRYAFLRRTLSVPDERHHMAQPDFTARLLRDGVFINDVPGRFTNGYGVRPEEVAPFFEQHGFSTLTLLAAEGILASIQRCLTELAAADPAAYMAALEVTIETASDPCILGMANHLLYVGKKE